MAGPTVKRRRAGAERRATERYGESGPLPLSALLVSKRWHRNPRRQRVYIGVEGVGYVPLSLAQTKGLASQLWSLSDPAAQAPDPPG